MSVFASPSNERDVVCYLLSVVRWIIHHSSSAIWPCSVIDDWSGFRTQDGVLGKAVSRHSLLTLVWPHENGFELGIIDYLGDKQLSQPVVRLRPWEGLAACSWLDVYYLFCLSVCVSGPHARPSFLYFRPQEEELSPHRVCATSAAGSLILAGGHVAWGCLLWTLLLSCYRSLLSHLNLVCLWSVQWHWITRGLFLGWPSSAF